MSRIGKKPVSIPDGVKAGETIHGTITYPGYEGLTLEMAIERIEPERLFSYRWHPGDPTTYNQIWSSEDGLNWTLNGTGPWSGTHTCGCVVFNNRMWVIGGGGSSASPG